MNKSLVRSILLYAPLCVGCMELWSCHTPLAAAQKSDEKILIGECRKDWLQYKVYRLPPEPGARDYHGRRTVALNIRVINMQDNTSPLRRQSADLEQYNIQYEYLLNGCKNELILNGKKTVSYPVSYSYENNYNAFPFESINVGYAVSAKARAYQLVYVDRVFAHDTVTFSLSL